MGRGPRSQEQALRVASLPRRIAKPERVGQRRYFVEQIKAPWGSEKTRSDEPGYLGALKRETTTPGGAYDKSRAQLAIREEIAADDHGRMRWVPHGSSLLIKGHEGIGHLHDMRKLCDQLNRQPLGSYVSEQALDDGRLSVGQYSRHLDQFGNVVNVSDESNIFDVSDPGEAEAAQSYHRQLSERIAAGDKWSAETALSSLRVN